MFGLNIAMIDGLKQMKTKIILALFALVIVSGCIQQGPGEGAEICVDLCGDGICQDEAHLGGVYINEEKPPCLEAAESCPEDCLKEQRCSDGTLKNRCSSTKPKYCSLALALVDSCRVCGCPEDEACQPDGGCEQKLLALPLDGVYI